MLQRFYQLIIIKQKQFSFKIIQHEKYSLTKFFGDNNLIKHLVQSISDNSDELFVSDANYKNIRVTQTPIETQTIGDSSASKEENLLTALRKLKQEVKNKMI